MSWAEWHVAYPDGMLTDFGVVLQELAMFGCVDEAHVVPDDLAGSLVIGIVTSEPLAAMQPPLGMLSSRLNSVWCQVDGERSVGFLLKSPAAPVTTKGWA